MPATWTRWRWWGNCSRHAERYGGKDVDNAQSSNARALVTRLSDITTAIWQVIMSTLRWPPDSRQDRWKLWLADDSSVLAGNYWLISRPDALATSSYSNCKCSNVWYGLRHSWHFWSEVHCRVKWRDCRKLKQSWYFLTILIHSSADTDLNFLQTYKGCLPAPQEMQVVSTLAK